MQQISFDNIVINTFLEAAPPLQIAPTSLGCNLG